MSWFQAAVISACLVPIVAYLLHLIWRDTWPKSQHRSYFSDCKRFPED